MVAGVLDACPICGAADGNCSSPGFTPAVIDRVLFEEWGSEPVDRTVQVPHDVYEPKAGKMRPPLYRKGDRISVEEAQRLGLIPVESEQPPARETK